MFKRVVEADFQDVLPNTAFAGCWCCCCLIVNFVLIILFFPCTMTQLGQFKYGIMRNKITGYVDLDQHFEPGRYWIGFWQEIVEFPSPLQTIEFSEEKPEEGVQHLTVLRSRDKDGKQVSLDISIQYRLPKANIGLIYKDMLLAYEDIFIAELRDQLAKAANLYAIEDTWQNYESVVDLMRLRCEAILKKRHVQCWGLQLWGVGLTKRYETKLIETQVKKQAQRTAIATKIQASVRATTRVLLAEYKKNVTILRAAGDANAYKITQLAYANARANLVSAQAKALQIIRDHVCPAFARVGDNGTGIATCHQSHAMEGKQLVAYQNQVLLKNLKSTHVNLPMPAGLKRPMAADIEASRKIMKGETTPARRLKLSKRRLTLHDSRDSDAQSPSVGNIGDASENAHSPNRLLDMDTLGEQLGYDPERDVSLGFHEL